MKVSFMWPTDTTMDHFTPAVHARMGHHKHKTYLELSGLHLHACFLLRCGKQSRYWNHFCDHAEPHIVGPDWREFTGFQIGHSVAVHMGHCEKVTLWHGITNSR